jgi:hypothetical protein
MSTRPAVSAGEVAVICVLLTTTFVAAAAPNVTVAPAAKFVPVIVTAVPPAVDPLFGDTLLTVGKAVFVSAKSAELAPVALATTLYGPAVLLAVNVAAVATPEELVVVV